MFLSVPEDRSKNELVQSLLDQFDDIESCEIYLDRIIKRMQKAIDFQPLCEKQIKGMHYMGLLRSCEVVIAAHKHRLAAEEKARLDLITKLEEEKMSAMKAKEEKKMPHKEDSHHEKMKEEKKPVAKCKMMKKTSRGK